MAQLRVHPQRSPMNWMRTNENTWTNYTGCKIIIFDEVVICLSSLENQIMCNIALNALDRYYDMCIRNYRRDFMMPKPLDILHRWMSSIVTRSTFNIFGLGLKTTTFLEFRRFNYRRPCANDQYKLHAPRFVVESVKFIEKHGSTKSGIFLRGGNYFRPFEVAYQILRGDDHNVSINTDVLELGAVLKHYLESMPEGLFTDALEYQFVKALGFDLQNRVKIFNLLLQVLPKENRETLYLLIGLLHKITRTRGSGMESRLLSEIFCPILFRYKGYVENNCMEVIQVLIEYFPVVFTLKASQLDLIYTQMAIEYPRKLGDHLYRRSHQCHWKMSDIPPALRILSNQMRSYNACETDSYHHLKFKPPNSQMDSHILNTSSFLLLMDQTKNTDASDDSNQFPGFEMVEMETPTPTGNKLSLNDSSSDYRLRIQVPGPVAVVEEVPRSVSQYKDVSVVEVLDRTEDDRSNLTKSVETPLETAHSKWETGSEPQYKDVSVVEVLDRTEDDGNYLTCKPREAPLAKCEDENAFESYDPSDKNVKHMTTWAQSVADNRAEEAGGTSNVQPRTESS